MFYLKASYFGPPHNPVSDNVEYGNSASKSRGVKSMQKTDMFSRRCHLIINPCASYHHMHSTGRMHESVAPNATSWQKQKPISGVTYTLFQNHNFQ